MHIHILGICGTFMGSLAIIARQLGHRITGSDANVYPPMSTQLEDQGIELMEGYSVAHLSPAPDLVIVGNSMSRGNVAVEHMLNESIPYISGPQWLFENVLIHRSVLAVAGTHGKTTTSSLLAWILEYSGLNPGFLIGGVPQNFNTSARVGGSDLFVIEADEYDSAFFDKRSKFVHYHPRYVVLNNIEFDHADIFDDIEDIIKQFHHLIRTVCSNGKIFVNANDSNLHKVLAKGCWTHIDSFGPTRQTVPIESSVADTRDYSTAKTDGQANSIEFVNNWTVSALSADSSKFEISLNEKSVGSVEWSLIGEHNMLNALAATCAANSVGVPPDSAIAAISTFRPPKRRLERKALRNGISVIDDFAHHPTAISETLNALRQECPDMRLIAIFEPRSNTMKLGLHQNELIEALDTADMSFVLMPEGLDWNLPPRNNFVIENYADALFDRVIGVMKKGDCLCVMSNGAFDGIADRLAKYVNDLT